MGLLEGKVAIVTGSGRGVGRGEALAMAREGARLIINDLGGALDGKGERTMVADQVVEEIKTLGGQAAADYSDVGTLEGVENMIWKALSKFGNRQSEIRNPISL
jgi:NAD(P)-dependent dehydrogenase (short-subunit alcohol dehydrogenase family)